MSDQPEFEELEHIPWSALAVKPPDSRLRLVYVALGVVAAIGLGLVAARWLLPGDGESTITLPPVAATDQAATAQRVVAADITNPVPAVVTTTAATGESSVSAGVGLYSEADLMAIAVDDESRLAAMRAEWFVQDYFTVDGDEQIANELEALIGNVALPHRASTGSSYVEWARSFAIVSPTPGRYVVEVAYRVLSSTTDGAFIRMPVRAVAITVEIDVDGAMMIVDLPASTEIPATTAMPDTTGTPGTPPDDVLTAALLSVQGLGIDASILDATSDGSTWRFVIEVSDPSGIHWPITVLVPSS